MLMKPIAPRASGRRDRSQRLNQRGSTLLESLISILVLSIAVIGMLGIQIRTLAETQTGVRRAQAVRLIEDLSERIKANPAGYKLMTGYPIGWGSAATTADCRTKPCDSSQLAAWDIDAWKTSVSNTLPQGDATVFFSSDESTTATQRQLGVMVAWKNNERPSDSTLTAPSKYVAPFQIPSSSVSTGVACPASKICHVVYFQP